MAIWEPGNFPEISRKISRNFPGNFQEIFLEISRNFPGYLQEMSTTVYETQLCFLLGCSMLWKQTTYNKITAVP